MTKEGFGSLKSDTDLYFYDPITERLTHYSTWTTGKRHLIAYPYKLIPSQTPGKIWSIGSKNHIFAFKRQDMDIQIDETIQIPQTQVNTILEEDDKHYDRDIGWALGLWPVEKQPKNSPEIEETSPESRKQTTEKYGFPPRTKA